jgi:hypothetical protein
VLEGDGLVFAADAAGLPPDAISDLASRVDALVLGGVDESKVPDVVVGLVSVDVVYLMSGWDGSVVLLPDDVVLHPKPPSVGASAVALRGEVRGVHASSLTASHVHRIPGITGSRSERLALGMRKKRE